MQKEGTEVPFREQDDLTGRQRCPTQGQAQPASCRTTLRLALPSTAWQLPRLPQAPIFQFSLARSVEGWMTPASCWGCFC